MAHHLCVSEWLLGGERNSKMDSLCVQKRDTKEEFGRSLSGVTNDVTRVPHLHSFRTQNSPHTLRCWLGFCLSLTRLALFSICNNMWVYLYHRCISPAEKMHRADQIEDIFVTQMCNPNAAFKTKSEIILTSFHLHHCYGKCFFKSFF